MNSPHFQMSELLAQPAGQRLHLVGAGGCGMSALGHLWLDLGGVVSGSDLVPSGFVQGLHRRGAAIHLGHAASHVTGQGTSPEPCALVVHTSAVGPDHPELRAAREHGIPILKRAQALAALQRLQSGLCVAGMHGKTTTTALLAFALDQLGIASSYAIGADVPQLECHARFRPQTGAAVPWFLVETDESDGTLTEFAPDHAILLNVDAEHLDHFNGIEGVCQEFARFVAQVRQHLVFCADDVRLRQMCASRPNTLSYGFHAEADYRLELSGPGSFGVWHAGAKLGSFTTLLLGEKNISNCGAVIALLDQLGISPEKIAGALALFRGARRRQQLLYADVRCRLYDDYGHHPAEILATLRAFKSLAPGRLLVAFQPHRYTRTQYLFDDFVGSFGDADLLWLAEIYPASEPAIPGVSSALLAEAIRLRGQAVEYVPAVADVANRVRAALQPGDWVLFLGAGDITEAAHELAQHLRSQAAAGEAEVHPSRPQSHVSIAPGAPARWFEELSRRLSPQSVLRLDEPMARHTTFRIGGAADLFIAPAGEADLSATLHFCAERQAPVFLLGRGSNLLIRDTGIRGVVIALTDDAFSQVRIEGARLSCGAGAKLKSVSQEALKAGLTGLEFMDGIPGSVGGAMRMNAGAHGARFYDVAETVRFMDYSGQARELKAADTGARYRGCPLFYSNIALGAVLRGQPAEREAIGARINAFNERRWASQPPQPSAGCVFKNPPTMSAGRLVEELGLKGARVGGAAVSTLHGNFIVNEGGATAADVLQLIDLIKRQALAQRGITLETEVEILGAQQ